ncbi:MAG: LysM peptidoglycan-binding domain-containing protein [Desulfobacterales bacterium]|nr:LysM peptidoglycan-binding domain-containing protein [Desulfobacterales bacterium]
MRKLRGIHFFMILMLSLCFILSPLAQEKKETEDVYTIKQGDTLWDISSKLLKDPFLWPKLWQRNLYITNPHWIYPGQSIRLSPLEDLKKEEPKKVVVEEKAKEEKPKEVAVETEVKKVEPPPIEKKVEVVVEAKPAEAKPTFFQDVRSAGFLSDIGFRGIGIILDSKEGKHLIALNDIVYLAFKTSKPIMIGDKYTVFRASDVVRHPVTDQKLGIKYSIIGNVQVIDQHGNFFTARVIEAFDAMVKGDMLRPYMKEKMEGEERK